MKLLLSGFLSLFFFSQLVVSQSVGDKTTYDHYTIFESPTRTLIPLDGEWKYLKEDETQGSILVPYRSNTPKKISLTKSLVIPKAKGKLLEFVSSGINHSASLSINDQFISAHQGGFLPFKLIIPLEFLNNEDHVKVDLDVDETLSADNSLPILPKPGDPLSYRGFLGQSWLMIRPAISIEYPLFNYQVDLLKNDVKLKASVSVKAAEFVSNEAGIHEEWMTEGAPIEVSYSISDENDPAQIIFSGTQNSTINSERLISIDFSEVVGKPELWSPENPKMYLATVSVKVAGALMDEIIFPIGFRQLEFRSNGLFVNGKETRLKGFNAIEDYRYKNTAEEESQMLAKLQTVKNSGANSIRFVGFPPAKSTIKNCDKLGLLVFSEIPSFNIPRKILESKNFQLHSENMLRTLTLRDKLNPSFIAIGIGGNYLGTNDAEIANRYSKLIKSLTPNVLTYLTTKDISLREKFTDFDMIGLDLADLSLSDFKMLTEGLSASDHFFISNYGKEIYPENHNGYSDEKSQEYQAKYFMDRYKLIKPSTTLIGSFAGTLNDYMTNAPRLISGNADPKMVTTGLLNEDLTPRTAFTYLTKLYNNEITFNPPIGKYQSGVKVVFPILGVIMIFIFMFFFSSNRRFRDNLTRSFSRSFSFFSDIRDHRVILGLQTAGLVFLLTTSWAMFLLSYCYGLRNSQTFDYLLSILLPWNGIKETVIWWTWNPISGILILSFLLLIILLLTICIPVVFGWFTKRKITFSQSLIAIIWSASPTLIIVLIAMIFEQIAASASFMVPYIFYFVIFMMLWTYFRILKGIRIIIVSNPFKVYFIGFFLLGLLLAATYFHYEHYYNAADYIMNALAAFK